MTNPEMLTEDEVLEAIQSCGADLHGRVALTYTTGVYELSHPTLVAVKFAEAVQLAFARKNGAPLPVEV